MFFSAFLISSSDAPTDPCTIASDPPPRAENFSTIVARIIFALIFSEAIIKLYEFLPVLSKTAHQPRFCATALAITLMPPAPNCSSNIRYPSSDDGTPSAMARQYFFVTAVIAEESRDTSACRFFTESVMLSVFVESKALRFLVISCFSA